MTPVLCEECLVKLICCFCVKQIQTTDKDPLIIQMRSEGRDKEYREGVMTFNCHARCFEERIDENIPFIWFSETNQ